MTTQCSGAQVEERVQMPRVLWKGAISFGLVHIPVGLYSAEKRNSFDLTMLDRRTMTPVGFKRYKNTAKR